MKYEIGTFYSGNLGRTSLRFMIKVSKKLGFSSLEKLKLKYLNSNVTYNVLFCNIGNHYLTTNK